MISTIIIIWGVVLASSIVVSGIAAIVNVLIKRAERKKLGTKTDNVGSPYRLAVESDIDNAEDDDELDELDADCEDEQPMTAAAAKQLTIQIKKEMATNLPSIWKEEVEPIILEAIEDGEEKCKVIIDEGEPLRGMVIEYGKSLGFRCTPHDYDVEVFFVSWSVRDDNLNKLSHIF